MVQDVRYTQAWVLSCQEQRACVTIWPPLRHDPECIHHAERRWCGLMPPGKSTPEVFTRVIFVVLLSPLCAVEKQLTNYGGRCDEKRLRNCFVETCEIPGVIENFLLPSIGMNLMRSRH